MKLPNAMLCVEDGCGEVYSSLESPTATCPACGSRNPFPLSRAVERSNSPGMSTIRYMQRRRLERDATIRKAS